VKVHAGVGVSVVPLDALSAFLQHEFIAEVLHLSGTERLLFEGADDGDGAPGAYGVVRPSLVSAMYEGRQRHGNGFNGNGSKFSTNFRYRHPRKGVCR
jgi:hypothetical protein